MLINILKNSNLNLNERWLLMVYSKNFVKFSERHIFIMFMKGYFCCKAFFLFHTDSICSLVLPGLDLIDDLPFCHDIFGKHFYFIFSKLNNKLYIMIIDFIDWQSYFWWSCYCFAIKEWWLLICDRKEAFSKILIMDNF